MKRAIDKLIDKIDRAITFLSSDDFGVIIFSSLVVILAYHYLRWLLN